MLNCYIYINYEYKDYYLFNSIERLEEFHDHYLEPCTTEITIPSDEEILKLHLPIKVEVIEYYADSLYAKVKYENPPNQNNEYFVLSCYLNQYSPEDFTF